MSDKDITDKNYVITQDQKQIIKNSFYSYFNVYAPFFFSIATSFLMARLISIEAWAYLILAHSYVAIFNIVLSLIPPGVNTSSYYYISRYRALNQNNKLKSFIRNTISIKLILLIPTLFLTYTSIILFPALFVANLEDNSILFVLLSPLILINGFEIVFLAMIQSFDMFKTTFIVLLIRYGIEISGYIYAIIFLDSINIEIIAIIQLLARIIPFIITIFIISLKYSKINITDEERETFKESFKNTIKYGSPIMIGGIFSDILKETNTQAIGLFEAKEMVTGYNISNNYRNVSLHSTAAISTPLILSFSSLDAKEDNEQIKKIGNYIVKYSIFILCLSAGLLIVIRDFFLSFIYGESYLIFSNLIIMMIIAPIFAVMASTFEPLIMAKKKTKIITYIRIAEFSIYLPLFLIGLIFFNLIVAVFFSCIAITIIMILRVVLSYKILNYRLDLKSFCLLYLSFFISIGIVFLLEFLFLTNFNRTLLQNLNLGIFANFNIFSLILFLALYILLVLIFQIFTLKEVNIVESLLEKKFEKLYKILKLPFKIIKRFIK